jgi:hypothetical protein
MPAFDMIKIPGGVQPDDPAVEFNIWTQVSSYPYTVGPELIPGGTTWGSADGSTAEVVVKGGSAPAASSGSSGNATVTPSTSENTQTVEPKDCDVQYIRRSFSA